MTWFSAIFSGWLSSNQRLNQITYYVFVKFQIVVQPRCYIPLVMYHFRAIWISIKLIKLNLTKSQFFPFMSSSFLQFHTFSDLLFPSIFDTFLFYMQWRTLLLMDFTLLFKLGKCRFPRSSHRRKTMWTWRNWRKCRKTGSSYLNNWRKYRKKYIPISITDEKIELTQDDKLKNRRE